VTFPANDNALRATLRALDLFCPSCRAGVGEMCHPPLDGYSGLDNHDYFSHHAARVAALREVGDANAAREILRAILAPRKTERNEA
jgi:hypothetical protein